MTERKHASLLDKRLRNIIIIAVIAVVGIIVYFAVLAPLLNDGEETTEPVKLLEGEVYASNTKDSVCMYEHIERADIKEIIVHNDKGEYSFYREGDSLLIRGKEGAPCSSQVLALLVSATGFTSAVPLSNGAPRLDDPSDDLSVYGLGEDQRNNWFIITKNDGTSYKVFIGSEITSGGGFYAMLDGRDAVYILAPTLAATVLNDINNLITPTLAYPIQSSGVNSVDDFWIYKDGELLYWLDMIPSSESGVSGSIQYELRRPEGYKPNYTAYSTFLSIFAEFVGTKTVSSGSLTQSLPDEELAKYGLDFDNPYYGVHYKYDDTETYIIFSEPDEDGNMYAYTTVYNLIAEINISEAYFINWDLLSLLEHRIFGENINNVASITISGEINNGEEKLSVDAAFSLYDGDQGTDALKIKNDKTGAYYGKDDITNFRSLYYDVVAMYLQDYAPTTDISTMTKLCDVSIKLNNGDTQSFSFYAYSTRQCLYTINGEGKFYVKRDNVEKLLRDTDRFLNHKTIDSSSDN